MNTLQLTDATIKKTNLSPWSLSVISSDVQRPNKGMFTKEMYIYVHMYSIKILSLSFQFSACDKFCSQVVGLRV